MCEFIITALHIHNCVFNEKMKKKNLDTHTPFSILPYINSDHLVHKYKQNTRDQIYKKKIFVFYSNITLHPHIQDAMPPAGMGLRTTR